MKKITCTLLAVAIAGLTVLLPGKARAQNAQGQSVATIGAGASLAGLVFAFVKNASNQGSDYSSKLTSTPAILASYDYGIADRFSLGLAFSYQQFGVQYTNYTYTNSQGVDVTGSFSDKLSRINFGLRPIFHFGTDNKMDGYFGARISTT